LVEPAKVRESEKLDRGFGRISGTVSPGDVQAEWMVVYLLKVECDEDWATLRQQVADGTLSGNPATWSPAVLEQVR
jgi:hypothetical protein